MAMASALLAAFMTVVILMHGESAGPMLSETLEFVPFLNMAVPVFPGTTLVSTPMESSVNVAHESTPPIPGLMQRGIPETPLPQDGVRPYVAWLMSFPNRYVLQSLFSTKQQLLLD
jgi:hypothetical protein